MFKLGIIGIVKRMFVFIWCFICLMLIIGLIKSGKFFFSVWEVNFIDGLVFKCDVIWGWRNGGKWGKLKRVFVFIVENWCKMFCIFVSCKSDVNVWFMELVCLERNFNKRDLWYWFFVVNLFNLFC